MKRSKKAISLVIAAIIVLSIFTPAIGSDSVSTAKERIVVGFKNSVAVSVQDSLIANHDGSVLKRCEALNFAVVLVNAEDAEEFISEVSKEAVVRYAEVDVPVHAVESAMYTPNDPLYSSQWGPQNIKADLAWDIEQGSTGVKIAIVDTGIDYTHEDLGNYVSGGYDWVNGDTDPWDDNGHGTHCAGIAAAVMDNYLGIAGIAQVSVMAEKVLDEYGSGYASDVAMGIWDAADQGADVISLSLGGGPAPVMEDACNYAWSSGCVLVGASGNDYGGPIIYPAAYDSVIAVGSIGPSNVLSYFSNYGPEQELVAPGESVLSSVPGDGYESWDGTSMSTPHVAGVAALVFSKDPSKTNAQVRSILDATADDLGTPGWDDHYGFGRVDAEEAVGGGGPVPSCKVLFDQGHANYIDSSIGTWDTFILYMENAGCQVDILSTVVTPAILSEYDVFITPLPQTYFTGAEITAINDFIADGNGALFIGEWGGYWNGNMNYILNGYGINLNSDAVYDPTNNDAGNSMWPIIHEFAAHPVTAGIESYVEYAGCSLGVSGDAEGLAWGDEDSYAMAMAGIEGEGVDSASIPEDAIGKKVIEPPITLAVWKGDGKAAAIGDANMFGDADCDGDDIINIDEYDNAQLIEQMVGWLCGVGPVPPTGKILFDASHDTDGDDSILNGYSDFAAALTAAGYTVDELTTGPITSELLSEYCALVLCDPEIAFTSDEISAILGFVEEGRGLLVLGEHSDLEGVNTNLNEVINAVGLNLNPDAIYDDTNNHAGTNYWPLIYNFAPHPVTDGLSEISLIAGSSLDTTAPGYAIGWGDDDSYTVSGTVMAGGEDEELGELGNSITEKEISNDIITELRIESPYEVPTIIDATVYWTFEITNPNQTASPGETAYYEMRIENLVDSTEPLYFDYFGVSFVPGLPVSYGDWFFDIDWDAVQGLLPGEVYVGPFGHFEWYDVPLGYVQGGVMEAGASPPAEPPYISVPYTCTIISPVSAPIALAASEYGAGKAVAIGDSNLLKNEYIGLYDNAQFGIDAIEWICPYMPVEEPDIWVDPTSFDVTLPEDTVEDYVMTIGNDGDADLTYDIHDEGDEIPTALITLETMAIDDPTTGAKATVSTITVSPTLLEGYDIAVIGGGQGYGPQLEAGLDALGANADLIYPADITVPLLSGYDLVWIPCGGASAVDSAGKADEVLTYVNNGGGLILTQPNTVMTPQCLPYEWQITDAYYDDAKAAAILDPTHELTIGLTVDDMPDAFDRSGTVDPAYTILALSGEGEPSFGACSYGSGRVIIEMDAPYPCEDVTGDNPNLADAMVERMVTWVSQDEAPPVEGWLDENPKTGTVPPGEFDNIMVTINTTGLPLGAHYAEIIIENNDPDENPTIVPVNLTVAPACEVLFEQWNYTMGAFTRMQFGASPAIADLGVNEFGEEPEEDLEIVTGSDECYPYGEEAGLWRCFDSQGNIEWMTDTQSDEARSSVAIVDLEEDGYLEIVGGTTSGETVEVMDRFGNFVWTFPDPPRAGNFMWHSSPAVADIAHVEGLEVIIGNRALYAVFCFDGDNSDGIDEGINASLIDWSTIGEGTMPWEGVEGIDWDLLWFYEVNGSVISTPAIGDVDNDGQLEVIFGAGYVEWGSYDGEVYCLDGATGALEWSYQTGGDAVDASAALADFDSDGDLEIVIGSNDGKVYFIDGDENDNGIIDVPEVTSYQTGDAVHSSAAVGDVDDDDDLEVIVGSNDGKVYSFDYDPVTNTVTKNWEYATAGAVYSSPALAYRGGSLDVYVGSEDGIMYLLDGTTGNMMGCFFTDGPIRTSPAVADIDADGKLEILFTSWSPEYYPYEMTRERAEIEQMEGDIFWCLEDNESMVDPYLTEWQMFRHDALRTGCYEGLPPVEETIVSIDDASAGAGESTTTPIMINNVMNVGSAMINLTFNASVVHVTNVSGGDFDFMDAVIDNTTGFARIGAMQLASPGMDGDVKLCDVELLAVGSTDETSPLDLEIEDLKDATPEGNDIPAGVDCGVFTVVEEIPPVVTNPSAIPDTIPDDTDNDPRCGETSQLNITATDESGVESVTIDLSAIGGSATAEMTNIEGDIWSIETNASAGCIGTHSLLVTATDIHGNYNDSVSITLRVLNNGDVSEDGTVTLYDAFYLAKHVLGKPGFEDINEGVAEVSGDCALAMHDAMYLAKHVLGKTGFDVLH